MKKYDNVFINGKIFTSDDENLYADSFAVKDGKFVWVGKESDIDLSKEDCIDLRGRRVLPGFLDSHMHPIMLASNERQTTCLPPNINSIEELIEAIKKVRESKGPNQWILGWGYDESKLAEGRTPTRYDLDKGASDVPVCIVRSCAHTRCVNSKVLEMAGISKDTPDIPGGEIGKDENGEPNGILKENARDYIMDLMPVDTEEDVIDNLLNISDVLLSQGITGIADMGNLEPVDYYDTYLKAREQGFKPKVSMYYIWDYFKNDKNFKMDSSKLQPNIPIRVAGLKIIGDGGISGRTAWCDRPYLGGNGDEYGISTCTEEDILSAIKFCKENKAQLSVHCMGQRSTDMAVDIISKERNWLDGKIPHARIEHASMPTEKSIKKSAKSGIAFVTQPIFLYAEVERYMENLGLEWTQSTFPISDMIKSGINLAFSTDAPATPLACASDPMFCLKAAVTRKAHDGTDCGEKHKVDIETAIKLYTAACGPIMGFDNVGMIKEGFCADFIILDKDILSINPEDIDKIKVESTYVDGKKVYENKYTLTC